MANSYQLYSTVVKIKEVKIFKFKIKIFDEQVFYVYYSNMFIFLIIGNIITIIINKT